MRRRGLTAATSPGANGKPRLVTAMSLATNGSRRLVKIPKSFPGQPQNNTHSARALFLSKLRGILGVGGEGSP